MAAFESYKAISFSSTEEDNSLGEFPLNIEILKKRSSTDINEDDEKK